MPTDCSPPAATPLDEPQQLWYPVSLLAGTPPTVLEQMGIEVSYKLVNGQRRSEFTFGEDLDPR